MTWTFETSQGYESAKIASIAVPYLQGFALDIGCGVNKVWPGLIGIDSGADFGRGVADIVADCGNLTMFASNGVDAIFSSHMLEHIPKDDVPAVLEEWARVLKVGGYLVLYLPSGNLYPKMGEDGANPQHKWDPMPGDIESLLQLMASAGKFGWELIESQERSGTNEYSLYIVARKTRAGWKENLWQRNPGGKKRALVIRYGAIGDQIIAASVLPGLRKQGYHVSYNTTSPGRAVIRHDPHVDEWLIQEKDFVPNQELAHYWKGLEERYDLIVNLCESIEGTLLALPGRRESMMAPAIRRKLLDLNYLEHTHDLAGVPHDFAPKFYPTKEEVEFSRIERARMTGPVVAWALTGSSYHKFYPFVDIVARWLLDRTPAHIVFLGDAGDGKVIGDAVVEQLGKVKCDMRRVHLKSGLFDVRQAISFALQADCVVGPETGVLNAVSMEAMPKVIYLSHSSAHNLVKHWQNTYAILPDAEKVPCYPCHMMHYDWSNCFQDQASKAAICAASIMPQSIFEAIAKALIRREKAKEAAD